MAESYVTAEDYERLFPGGEIPPETALAAASQHIDSMTFNRIRAAGGLDGLTESQREAVKEAVCRQARFEAENADRFSFSMASYSINGVSMKAAYGEGVRYYGGVASPGEVRSLLGQTGLMCRVLGGSL